MTKEEIAAVLMEHGFAKHNDYHDEIVLRSDSRPGTAWVRPPKPDTGLPSLSVTASLQVAQWLLERSGTTRTDRAGAPLWAGKELIALLQALGWQR